MEYCISPRQIYLGFRSPRANGIYRAHNGTLTVRKEPKAFGAAVGFDDGSQGAWMNRLIRAFPLAGTTLNAVVSNLQTHLRDSADGAEGTASASPASTN